MELSRPDFIEHFEVAFEMQCLWKWPRHRKSAPPWLSSCFYHGIKRSSGEVDATTQRFAELIDPLLDELHQTTPQGQALERRVVTGKIYDRLAAGGVEVRIRPPIKARTVRSDFG